MPTTRLSSISSIISDLRMTWCTASVIVGLHLNLMSRTGHRLEPFAEVLNGSDSRRGYEFSLLDRKVVTKTKQSHFQFSAAHEFVEQALVDGHSVAATCC